MALDERVRLSMPAVLSCRRPRINARQDVLLLIHARAGVVHDEPAGWTPMEFELAPIALRVEQRQIGGAAELTDHLTLKGSPTEPDGTWSGAAESSASARPWQARRPL